MEMTVRCLSQAHHEVFIDNGCGIVVTYLIGLENVRRGLATYGLKECAVAIDDQKFVLRPPATSVWGRRC